MSERAGLAAMKSQKGIIRAVELLFSIIAFATVAASPYVALIGSKLQFQIAVGVMAFLAAIGLSVWNMLQTVGQPVKPIEFGVCFFFVPMFFLSSILCATAAQNTPDLEASAAFGFLSAMLWAYDATLAYGEWKMADGGGSYNTM